MTTRPSRARGCRPVRAVVFSGRRARGLVARDVTGAYLIEDGLDESVFDLDGLHSRLLVINGYWLADGFFRRRPVEVCNGQVIAVDIGDPALEKVAEAGVSVLADGDEEVGCEYPCD